jgi:hypothetical protein
MVVRIISTIDDANAIIVPMIVAVSKYIIVSFGLEYIAGTCSLPLITFSS